MEILCSIFIFVCIYLFARGIGSYEEPGPPEVYVPKAQSMDLMMKWYINHINKFGVTNRIRIDSYEDTIEVVNHYNLLNTGCGASSRNYLYTNDATNETANYAINHPNRTDEYNGQKCPGHGTIFYMSDFTCMQWHNQANSFSLPKVMVYPILPHLRNPLDQYQLLQRLGPSRELSIIEERIRDLHPELFI
jgi:hypothetical protein